MGEFEELHSNKIVPLSEEDFDGFVKNLVGKKEVMPL